MMGKFANRHFPSLNPGTGTVFNIFEDSSH